MFLFFLQKPLVINCFVAMFAVTILVTAASKNAPAIAAVSDERDKCLNAAALVRDNALAAAVIAKGVDEAACTANHKNSRITCVETMDTDRLNCLAGSVAAQLVATGVYAVKAGGCAALVVPPLIAACEAAMLVDYLIVTAGITSAFIGCMVIAENTRTNCDNTVDRNLNACNGNALGAYNGAVQKANDAYNRTADACPAAVVPNKKININSRIGATLK